MQLIMFQLQPVFDGFNQSLEHLNRQVEKLDRDVAQVKSRQLEAELQVMPLGSPELKDVEEERLDARVAEVLEQVRTLQQQMENQRREVDNSLHSQHAILQYNLTSFKTDVDMKLKRHQMMQVSLQAVNATLAELKLDQDQPDKAEADLPPPPASDVRWEAIERLDNMVVNNTIRVGGLMEDVEVISGNIQQLRRDFKDLQKQINQTARTSQVQFMETVLEVEAAREVVLRQVSELAGNLSHQGERLQELDVDVDYLYNVIYKQNTSSDCDCKDLRAAVARLERGVANMTELANENRLALEEVGEGGEGQWGGVNNWEPAAEALQHGLQQVKEALASEKTWTQTLDHSLAQLSDSVKVGLAEVSTLKEVDRKLMGDLERLSDFFNLLLKDAVRHDDVLEVLLGEEVPEFLKWPVQDQEAHSIPALKERLGLLQEQLRGHDVSISSLLGGREEVLSADQPSTSSELLPDDWLSGSMRSSSNGVSAREQKLALHPAGRHQDHRGDGGDLWNLEKRVEELGLKVLLLEKKYSTASASSEAPPSGVEARLQAEVTWLKRGLEEHLRMFKNVFSNADVLARADATLELDKLWQLVKNKDGKKKRGGDGREGGGRGNQRSRRDASSGLPVLSQDSVLLVASSPLRVSDGIVTLASSDSDVFTAPAEGVYLFVLTLDLRPGPAHVVLKRGSSTAAVSLHRLEVMEAGPVTGLGLLLLKQGEEVRLELKGGVWAESEDNVIAVLLMLL